MATTGILYKLCNVWIYTCVPIGHFSTQGMCFLRLSIISFSEIIHNVQRTTNSEVTNIRDYSVLKTPLC